MVSKTKLPYHWRLFLILLGFAWVMVACFVIFQYSRERAYKTESLNARLQLFNHHLIDALTSDSIDFDAVVARRRLPVDGLRVSIISIDGDLEFDNTLDSLPGTKHLDRPEIIKAFAQGSGYTTRRHSQSLDRTYFYSATRGDNYVVRSAVPYDLSLQEILRADKSFLWFMGAVTLCLSIVGYFATRSLGNTISRLNAFAARAERGERIREVEPFPADELGSISDHIVRLYARLQQTAAERDTEHAAAMREQQERIRIKKQLTNNINHELKTPVASIKLCLETALEHRDLPSERLWDLIEKSYAHTERLTALLNDVSALTRLDDGEANITRETLTLNDIVDEVVRDMTPRAAAAGMSIGIDMPPRMEMTGNRAYLHSIFSNLVANSIAYSRGTSISLRCSPVNPDTLLVEVSDDGVGISPEHLAHIFERFYRVDKGRSRQNGGTGLGLAIVKNAVQLHGGTIAAESEPGHGICFSFTLKRN